MAMIFCTTCDKMTIADVTEGRDDGYVALAFKCRECGIIEVKVKKESED